MAAAKTVVEMASQLLTNVISPKKFLTATEMFSDIFVVNVTGTPSIDTTLEAFTLWYRQLRLILSHYHTTSLIKFRIL